MSENYLKIEEYIREHHRLLKEHEDDAAGILVNKINDIWNTLTKKEQNKIRLISQELDGCKND